MKGLRTKYGKLYFTPPTYGTVRPFTVDVRGRYAPKYPRTTVNKNLFTIKLGFGIVNVIL
jgi:hypothetical protein